MSNMRSTKQSAYGYMLRSSALCGFRVLSDRMEMAPRRGEGNVLPLTVPGAV